MLPKACYHRWHPRQRNHPELAREAAVPVLQLEEAVQHALDAFLPFGVFTLLLFLVVQIVQDGIPPLGLTADAMSGFLKPRL